MQLNEWPEKRKLPLFLRQEFDFAKTQILGRPVLIAAAIAPEHSAAAVRKQFEVLQPKFDGELVYLRQQIDAYQRKRLIEQRVSFIVPETSSTFRPLQSTCETTFEKPKLRRIS